MLTQIKSVFGRAFGENVGASIEAVVQPIANDDRSLPRDIAKYVLTGEPTNVLSRTSAVPGISEKVGILCGDTWSLSSPKYSAHRKLLEEQGTWEAAPLLRLAQLYLSASKSPVTHAVHRFTVGAWKGGFEWVELFLRKTSAMAAAQASIGPGRLLALNI